MQSCGCDFNVMPIFICNLHVAQKSMSFVFPTPMQTHPGMFESSQVSLPSQLQPTQLFPPSLGLSQVNEEETEDVDVTNLSGETGPSLYKPPVPQPKRVYKKRGASAAPPPIMSGDPAARKAVSPLKTYRARQKAEKKEKEKQKQ